MGEIGTICKNARQGAAFDGRRYGQSDDVDYELFQICRSDDFRFSADKSRNSDYIGTDQLARATQRAQSFAFSDKTAAVTPVVDIMGPR